MAIKDIRPALRAFLLADAAISSAVGASRIYPIVLPQGIKLASVVYTRISGAGDHHMTGPSWLASPRLQIDAWAPTGDAAASLANLVKECLDGYQGVMGSGGFAVTVQGVFFDGERDDYDADTTMYRVSRDYFIWHEER